MKKSSWIKQADVAAVTAMPKPNQMPPLSIEHPQSNNAFEAGTTRSNVLLRVVEVTSVNRALDVAREHDAKLTG